MKATARQGRTLHPLTSSPCVFCLRQVCGEGYVLDLQLPGGPTHVVLLSLLSLMSHLRDEATSLLAPADNGSAKVLLRLPVQVGSGQVCCAGSELALVLCVHAVDKVCGHKKDPSAD